MNQRGGDGQMAQGLAARLTAIRDSLARLRLGDPDGLHDLRVAVRRLRAQLAPLRHLSGFRRLRRDLRRLVRHMAASGPRRDHEVRRLGLQTLHLPAGPALRACQRALTGGVPSQEFSPDGLDALLPRLTRDLARAWRGTDESVLTAVRAAHARRLLFRIQCALDGHHDLRELPDALHRLRLDCKRLRYLLPATAPAAGPLRAAQRALGDWRDLDLLTDALTEAGSRVVLQALAARRRQLMPLIENALQELGRLREADLS